MKSLHFSIILIVAAIMYSCSGSGPLGSKQNRVYIFKPDQPNAESQNTNDSVKTFEERALTMGSGVMASFEDPEEATNFLIAYDRGYTSRKDADGRYKISESNANFTDSIAKIVVQDPELGAAIVLENGYPGVEQIKAESYQSLGYRYGHFNRNNFSYSLRKQQHRFDWTKKHYDPSVNPWINPNYRRR